MAKETDSATANTEKQGVQETVTSKPDDSTSKPQIKPENKQKPSGEKSPVGTAKKSGNHLFLVLLLLIVAGGSGYAAFWGFNQIQDLRQQIDRQNAELNQVSLKVSKDIPNLAEQVSQQLGAQNQQYQGQIDEVSAYLAETARRFTESQGVTRYEWLLAEAEYLLRLAQQRLMLEKDAHSALAILQSADAVLRDAADANLIPIREQLAREMSALSKVQNLDAEGIYLQLNELIRAFDTWTPALAITSAAQELTADIASDKSWQDRISQYIQITEIKTKSKDLVEPNLIPLYRALIQQSLTQAQTALLKQRYDTYRAALLKADEWLDQYGASNNSLEQYQQPLRELANTPLDIDMPNIGNALSLLKGYIAEIYLLQRSAPQEK